jgi:hypothetical protein
MAIDRGEYRPIYEALFDGPDFKRLTPHARLTLVALKVKCGPLGIRVIPGYDSALRSWTGCSAREVARSLEALTATIPDPWVAIEDDVVWVIRSLEFEPSQNPNDRNHQKFVGRTVAALPRVALVRSFVDRYLDPWEGLRGVLPGSSKTLGSTSISTSTPTSPPLSSAASGGLQERFTAEPDRWVIVEMLEKVPLDQSANTWALRLAGYLDGLDGFSGPYVLSPELLATACRDYLSKERDFSPPHFRAFLRRVIDERRRAEPRPTEQSWTEKPPEAA